MSKTTLVIDSNNLKETKRQIELELDKIEKLQAEKILIEKTEKDYRGFKNRKKDWVIGKAHCELPYNCHGCEKKSKTIGDCIYIHGNIGTDYYARAFVTNNTHTYFHNHWTNIQRQNFQKKLNEVALKEFKKISKSLIFVLQTLVSNELNLKNNFPSFYHSEIKNEIWEETIKILDRYTDEDFKDLVKEKDSMCLGYSEKVICKQYLKEKRRNLFKVFEKLGDK